MKQVLSSGFIQFSNGTTDFAEVVLHPEVPSQFITIGVGNGFNGASSQLTPSEFISGPYDDIIFGLKLTGLLRFITKIGPGKVTAEEIINYCGSRS